MCAYRFTMTQVAEAHRAEEQVSENVVTLLHRSRMKQHQLAAAVGMSPQTMSRRLSGSQPWSFWEVQAIASFFEVTLEQLAGELPSLSQWSSVRHQGLEPRTRCFGGSPKSRADLRVVA